MATKPENPSPIFNLPVFIPENWTDITTSTSTTTTPVISTKIVGEIIAYQGTTLPSSNWLWCDGTGYLSALYTTLFDVIGYNYGQSAVANPSSSSTSSGADLNINPDVSVTKLDTSNTINSTATQFWTIVIPSNSNGGGTFNLNTPLEIYGGANFLPFGSATLTGITTIDSVFFDVYKDGVLHSILTATANTGTTPVVFTQSGNNATSISVFDTYYGNYNANFSPDLQSTTATYTFFVRCNYTLSSSVSGGSTSWTITLQPLCNTTLSNRTGSVVSGVGTFTWTSVLNTNYTAVSATWTGFPLFNVPNLSGKTPVGTDNTANIGTTYGGSSVVSGGNRVMSANQLATHSHSIDISPAGNMLVSFGQNNAIQGIGAGSGDIVKTALYGQSTYTATASNAGNNVELLPPFNVSNFIIRAN
jgi:microcystin-dependent protein